MAHSRLFFRLSYLLGLKPWDSGISPPELVEWVEGPTAMAPGRALDIGCGTGTNCAYMLDHGWTLTQNPEGVWHFNPPTDPSTTRGPP